MARPHLPRVVLAALFAFAAACDRSSGGSRSPSSAACGLAALAGPTALLAQFSVPNQTLASPPRNLPERLVVRMVAGPAYQAIVGRSDSLWIIGVEGALPANVKPGFGAIVLDQSGKSRGVLLYEGTPVEGAQPWNDPCRPRQQRPMRDAYTSILDVRKGTFPESPASTAQLV